MINSKIRKVGERLKSNSRSWPCQVLSYLANLVPCAGLSQGEEKQILGAFEDAVFHLTIRIPSASPTALCRAFAGHVICQGRPHPPPISTLNAITTLESVPSSARGGLVSAIKLKFRFRLITGEECDSEGKP